MSNVTISCFCYDVDICISHICFIKWDYGDFNFSLLPDFGSILWPQVGRQQIWFATIPESPRRYPSTAPVMRVAGMISDHRLWPNLDYIPWKTIIVICYIIQKNNFKAVYQVVGWDKWSGTMGFNKNIYMYLFTCHYKPVSNLAHRDESRKIWLSCTEPGHFATMLVILKVASQTICDDKKVTVI